jgi:hypothetical protein
MRLLRSCAIGFVFAFPAVAASVEGVVVNSVTGVPVPRAHVAVQGQVEGKPERFGTTTGADGRFSITDIPAGSYSTSAERVGFVSQFGSRDRITLRGGDTRSDIEIKLIPTGSITGRVTDADGRPVEGANVTAQGARSGESGTTDDKGEFRIGGLAPGRYRVRAGHGDIYVGPPEIRTDGTVDVHYASTYYPGAVSKEQAGKVEVRAGAESTGVDIRLLAVPFVRVSGKVIGIPRDVEEASLMVWQGSGGTGAQLKPDGSFEIWRLDPGKYWLAAEWNGANGQRGQTPGVEIEVAGSNIDKLELRVAPDSNIPGRLEFDDDQTKQAAGKTGEELQVSLSRATAEFGDSIDAAAVGTDGTFHLEKVPAGKYRVGVSLRGVYVKSMRLGSTVTEGETLDLMNGARGAELSLLLATADGIVSGNVVDETGSSAAAVVILNEPATESGFSSSQIGTKPDGAYTFAGLAPGTYQIVAVQDRDQDYEDLTEPVEVRAGQKITKDLKLQRP